MLAAGLGGVSAWVSGFKDRWWGERAGFCFNPVLIKSRPSHLIWGP